MTRPAPAIICVDCQERHASLTIRNRRLCAACFIRYVNSKIHKRMESYRFKTLAGEQKRHLLLPLSGGVSSLVLLQILDAQLQNQIGNRNRTAYCLTIVRVVLPNTRDSAAVEEEYRSLPQRFPLHDFLPPISLHHVFRLDQGLCHDLELLGIRVPPGESSESYLQRVLSATTSVTSGTDIESTLLRRLLVSVAQQQDCESVLWGHSDSRLAALTLAAVAKGRGGSVPSNIADGSSLHGVNFNYPARDLSKAELELYAQALSEPLTYETDGALAAQPALSIRNSSIDHLLTSYIASQGEKYPSIMANVVRTASKLHVTNNDPDVVACSFCIMPTSMASGEMAGRPVLCYGCQRIKQDVNA